MKNKVLALILALTAISWAQTSTQIAPSEQQKSTEPANHGCCNKTASADGKDAAMCARHAKHGKHAKNCCGGTKEAMACCGGKDSKSCMKDAKAAASCCKDCGKDQAASACCGKDCKESCCSKSTETALNCCHPASHS
jgi:hypothetical protein